MANLFDYLKWRGDIQMEIDGFNAVDNLIFSELVYVDLEDAVPEAWEPASPSQKRQRATKPARMRSKRRPFRSTNRKRFRCSSKPQGQGASGMC